MALFFIHLTSLVGLIDKYTKQEYFNSSSLYYNKQGGVDSEEHTEAWRSQSRHIHDCFLSDRNVDRFYVRV
ncbi:hypothetical protein D3C76_1780830 [compost metagenome]